MAYMRGDNYLWRDANGFHIWCRNGYDAWDCTGWHSRDEDAEAETSLRLGETTASGVCISQDVIDLLRQAPRLKELIG